ncbi:MAG: hypothetical protein HY906_12785 [Deltaproteobacteria bacterium]|nr:hypothetical protein [Deltaproteobacteria bacterium]
MFEALVALNRPVVNEPALKPIFDFERAHAAMISGALDKTLVEPWTS